MAQPVRAPPGVKSDRLWDLSEYEIEFDTRWDAPTEEGGGYESDINTSAPLSDRRDAPTEAGGGKSDVVGDLSDDEIELGTFAGATWGARWDAPTEAGGGKSDSAGELSDVEIQRGAGTSAWVPSSDRRNASAEAGGGGKSDSAGELSDVEIQRGAGTSASPPSSDRRNAPAEAGGGGQSAFVYRWDDSDDEIQFRADLMPGLRDRRVGGYESDSVESSSDDEIEFRARTNRKLKFK